MAGDEDYEHWPDESICFTKPAAAPPAPPSDNPPAPEAPKFSPALPPHFTQQPQPLYYAHQPSAMTYPQPQYYSHPPQGYYPPQYPQPAYYTYGAPAPAPPAPTPAPAMAAPPANYHVYQPAGTEPKAVPGAPQANVWLGRSKEQVEEDNMKIAKKEGAYDKRKMAPVGVKDDQFFWVVELDGKTTLREFRFIKEIKGEWKEDPRFEGAYYFVREEEKKDKK
ncbi:hypothetical protein PRZ48_007695 [Zasmidium cellare]|uniref:Uncharacterized protein n=1 Tax=Zasmidium cellare TaxID=395010 RepID=A0ABR0EK09_ZASCE|nr:hypothetical protein PRZ48_007695 [Zasmidium cellare]